MANCEQAALVTRTRRPGRETIFDPERGIVLSTSIYDTLREYHGSFLVCFRFRQLGGGEHEPVVTEYGVS